MLVFPVLKAFPAGGITLRKSLGPAPPAQFPNPRTLMDFFDRLWTLCLAALLALSVLPAVADAQQPSEQEGDTPTGVEFTAREKAWLAAASGHPRGRRDQLCALRVPGQQEAILRRRRRLHGDPQAAARRALRGPADAGLRRGGEQAAKARGGRGPGAGADRGARGVSSVHQAVPALRQRDRHARRLRLRDRAARLDARARRRGRGALFAAVARPRLSRTTR